VVHLQTSFSLRVTALQIRILKNANPWSGKKVSSFGKVKPLICQRQRREMFVECLPITEFSRCSAPEYPA
jgi:hypothetical protein